MELKDYYFILGVPRTATARDILRAFRELAKLYHPDVAGPQGTASFQDIVEAYEILSDPEHRRHYHHSLSTHVDVRPSAPPVGSARPQPEPLIPEQRSYRLYSQPEPMVPEPMSVLHDFGTISPSFDALYDRLRRNFTGRGTPKAERLESLNAELKLSPYEALRGVMVPVGIPVFVRCAACDGSGREWFSLCLTCQGQGMIETEQTISVQLPPGVRDGTIIEVPLRRMGIHNFSLRLHIRVTW
jgi:DnaJ-class molecular chaperone